MRIAGFQKLTLVDYPGLVAATVFTQGCNFRCGYCHNPQLVLPEHYQEPMPSEQVLDFLNGRRGKLDGVVITGGEPTIQQGLAEFIARIKEMGFAVKLDTNGSNPQILSSLLASKFLDYIAMDIKSSLLKYSEVTGTACDIERIKESIGIIINSGISYQFRTTLVKGHCSNEDLSDIQFLIRHGTHYVLQPLVLSEKMVDPHFSRHNQFSIQEVDILKSKYEKTKPLA